MINFDYTSDIHLDTHFLEQEISEKEFILKYGKYFKNKSSNILIISGDIGEDNEQNVNGLKHLRDLIGYEYIIFVIGNHDLYLNYESITFHKNSFNRVENLKSLIKKEKNIHFLDGNIIEIDGIRFGGTMGWYDGEYIKKNLDKKKEKDFNYIDNLWAEYYPDYSNTIGIESFNQLCESENKKIENIYKDCDVLITHVNPSIETKHTEKKYRKSDFSGYYSFDGSEYIKNTSAKVWVFGHSHYKTKFKLFGIDLISNHFGYKKEQYEGCSVENFKNV